MLMMHLVEGEHQAVMENLEFPVEGELWVVMASPESLVGLTQWALWV